MKKRTKIILLVSLGIIAIATQVLTNLFVFTPEEAMAMSLVWLCVYFFIGHRLGIIANKK
jgi:hypothetical protein